MKSLLIKTDIMVVKCIEEYIFAAVGNELQIFKDLQLKYKKTIFLEQKIHGMFFKEDSNNILIFGYEKLKLFHYDLKDCKLEQMHSLKLKDWILSGKLFDDDKIICVTAHNTVISYDQKNQAEKEMGCREKCILYSAYIVGQNEEDVIVLSGTVFSEVLIWQPWIGPHTNIEKAPVIHRLTGHKGVIFSVIYNPIEKLICTTSDDRTLRLWDIVESTLHNALKQPNEKIVPRCSLYGHTARVWRSLILKNRIISVGEDSQIIFWDTSGNMIRKIQAHQNDCIWSLDYQEVNNCIVTGGGDSGLHGHNLDLTKCITSDEFPTLDHSEALKKVALMSKQSIVAVTEAGTLMYLYSVENIWNVISKHTTLKNILLEVSPEKDKIALAGYDGKVHIYEQNCNTLICSKTIASVCFVPILSLHWLASDKILYCTAKGILVNVGINYVQSEQGILPASKERWTTCAVLSNSQCLIVGDRMGNIHVYEQDNSPSQIFQLKLVQTLHKIHDRLGVSCLNWNQHNQLLSAGRNGVINKFVISNAVNHQLQLISSEKIPFKWCAKIIPKFINETSETAIIGFFESKFVVWIPYLQQIVLEVDCGGGHRSWDFSFIDDSTFLFVYVKNKIVHRVICNVSSLLTRIYLHGFHSAEINIMIYLKQFEVFISGGEDTTLRTSIINRTESSKYQLYSDIRTLSVLRTHLSSIRSIDICAIDDARFLIFSGGGRAQLVISELALWNNSVECTPKTQYMLKDRRNKINEYDNDPETRMMDIKVHKISQENFAIAVGCSDGILRIYSLKILNDQYIVTLDFCLEYHKKCILKVGILDSNRLIVVTMATDGKIAFWDLNFIREKVISSNDGINEEMLNELLLTDNSLKTPCEVISAHQSGINSFCWRYLQNDKYLIITGGDDTAISLILVRITYDDKIKKMVVIKLAVWTTVAYHRAQVTGLQLFDKYLFSASIDQRISVLKLNVNPDANEIECDYIEQYCTTVADIQGMCLTKICRDKNEVNCCVYGKGVEIIKISLPCCT